MKKALSLIAAFVALTSAAESKNFLYDKNDLSFYFTIGGDLTFSYADDIDQVLLGSNEYISNYEGDRYIGKTKLSAKDIVFQTIDPNHSSFASDYIFKGYANMKGFNFEVGANLNQAQFGFAVAHSLFLTSLAPTKGKVATFAGVSRDTLGTPIPWEFVPFYDAGFSITDFSFVSGYRLLEKNSVLNLTLRALAGITHVDAKVNAAWQMPNYSTLPDNIKNYRLEDRTYSNVTWHTGAEIVPSIKFNKIELSAAAGYKFTRFDEFVIGANEDVRYLYGYNNMNLDHFYGSVRLTYALPSFNEVKYAQKGQ